MWISTKKQQRKAFWTVMSMLLIAIPLIAAAEALFVRLSWPYLAPLFKVFTPCPTFIAAMLLLWAVDYVLTKLRRFVGGETSEG